MDRLKNSKVYSMALIALFAALTAVFSQIIIPIGPVPINLALLSVFICGGVLGWKKASLSMVIYILLGIAGVPVFSGFQGGLAKIAGPTGGYIVGYLIAAFVIGIITDKFGRKILPLICSMILGLILCYAFGTIWFVLLMNQGIVASLMTCVIPFLPGDAVKIAAAVIVVKALSKTKLVP